MALAIKVKLGRNSVATDGDAVYGRDGEKVSLSALDGTTSVAGEWRKDSSTKKIAAVQDSPGKIELTMSPAAAGTYNFTANNKAEADSEEATASIQLELDKGEQSKASKFAAGTFWAVTIIVLYLVISGAVMFLGDQGNHPQKRSFVVAVLTVIVMFLLADAAGRVTNRKSGVWNVLKGKDKRASTSKIQALMWTLVVGGIVAMIAAYSAITDKAFQCHAVVVGDKLPEMCLPAEEATWTAYLFLLGVPLAAAAAAKGIVTTKVTNGTLQKTEAQQANVVEVATNDKGDADLVDIQYLLFNLIALLYVVLVFAQDRRLPVVPDLLVALTSAAAGTYVLNKSLTSNKPTITSVTPSNVRPGDTMTVTGQNLLLPGTDGKPPTELAAKVAGISASAIPGTPPGPTGSGSPAGDVLTIQAPEGLSASTETSPLVTVTTKANIETAGFPITLAPIVVLGWKGAAPSGDDRTKELVVTGLPGPSDAAGGPVQVTLGGISALGTVTAADAVQVTVPPKVSGDQVEVKVSHHGRSSEVVKLPVGV